MELQGIFDVGKYVFNRKTGHAGKVIGYSHQMLRRDGYMPTLRVLVDRINNQLHPKFVEEDVFTAWTSFQNR